MTSPTLTGRHIGEASRATAGLLDLLLDAAGLTSPDWFVLNTVAGHGAVSTTTLHDELTRPIAAAGGSSVVLVLDGLRSSGLVDITADGGETVRLSPEGQALHLRLRDLIARTTVQIYDGIPDADLATTRRVLAEVTQRANGQRLFLAGVGR